VVNAWDAPQVSSRLASGTATEIASEPSMDMKNTIAAAIGTDLR
jgi:hypothetical protein